jgi:serine/threonine protein kinase
MYIIMEMLNGSDLHSVVKNKPLPEAEAKKYFVQIVEAVDYLHRQDIVHRDLKVSHRYLGECFLGGNTDRHSWRTACSLPCRTAPSASR